MKIVDKLTAILLGIILFSCMENQPAMQLKSGDLLFQAATSGKLSSAIDKVTQTGDETHFSHVGMLQIDESGACFVLHAGIKDGSCRVTLEEFLKPEGDSVTTVVYRLKEPWQATIPAALAKASTMLGKPYNFSYVLSDSTLYCSEFIYKAFEADSVFKLNPMTFKDPATGDFFPTWIDFYTRLGMAIPEGQPGCNPNGMASSEKLERVGILAP